MRIRCSAVTPTAAAMSAQAAARSKSLDAEPSGHVRVVNTWRAKGSSASHTSAGPERSCAHRKPSLGSGSMADIIGLGIDITEIDRIADTIARHGDRFTRRIFTDGEIAYCMRRKTFAIHFAGRF